MVGNASGNLRTYPDKALIRVVVRNLCSCAKCPDEAIPVLAEIVHQHSRKRKCVGTMWRAAQVLCLMVIAIDSKNEFGKNIAARLFEIERIGAGWAVHASAQFSF